MGHVSLQLPATSLQSLPDSRSPTSLLSSREGLLPQTAGKPGLWKTGWGVLLGTYYTLRATSRSLLEIGPKGAKVEWENSS